MSRDVQQAKTLSLRSFITAALALLLMASAGKAAASSRPNIVLILGDDHGYGDVGAYGGPPNLTPNLDEVAAEGVRFTSFRVNPICAPTRASLLTGLYSVEAGIWRGPRKGIKPATPVRLRSGVRLLPEYLKEAGYATGLFGKWHLGLGSPDLPTERGFDDFVGFLEGSHPYWIGADSKLLNGERRLNTPGRHTTDVFTEAAIAFIRKNRERPFFCYVAFNAVHGPLAGRSRPDTSAKPDWLRRFSAPDTSRARQDYQAVLAHADDSVGKIRAVLREFDLHENTLLIYLSDNGALTQKFPGDNGLLRGQKNTTYEGGIRVPAMMEWPGRIQPRWTSAVAAVHFDLFATILDLAGVGQVESNGPARVQGVSLLPHLLSGGRVPIGDRYLYWEQFGSVAALRGQWKLVGQVPDHNGVFPQVSPALSQATYQLFDIWADPGERRDLAAELPERVEELKQHLIKWWQTIIDKL